MRRVAIALLLVLAVTVAADARFAASNGFSGRNLDCTSCHVPGAAPAATARLEGLPEQWRPDETYALQIGVEGGPRALPSPQPQGGFELEVREGVMAAGPGMDGLLRFPSPTSATYLPEGTLRRDWALAWTAPSATVPPVPIDVWLAVVSANGNHVIATNTTDGGETGDAVATLHVVVPPDPDVVAAWQALPLSPPIIDRIVETQQGFRVEGHHSDGNATHLGFYTPAFGWDNTTAAPEWSIITDERGLEQLQVRSEGFGRLSDAVDARPAQQGTPSPLAITLLALTIALARR